MPIVVLKQCQKEIGEFPLGIKEQLSDYLELLALGESVTTALIEVAQFNS
jgi:hypothetical protein